jgi:uncharacterized protein
MKSVYVTSIERFSGKTAVCLGLGKHFQDAGRKVGYIKPVSVQPWMFEGRIVDEDAAFVKETLQLQAAPWELSPVVITPDFLRDRLRRDEEIDLMDRVRSAVEQAGAGQDLLLLEGGATLREGYIVGLPTPQVAQALSSSVLVVIKFSDEAHLLDDALSAQARLSEVLGGILINRVPNESYNFVTEVAAPYLEKHGIPVFGVLPEVRSLAALSVDELIQALDAEVLARNTRPGAMVENLTVGAMNTEAALSRFRKQTNKAVITGGDRTDIQLAALETSTTALILTGNLHPSPLVVKQAKEFGTAVLLVPMNTMETIERIEGVYGKSRLGHPAKLRQFQSLLDKHLDFNRLAQVIGLD